ncbi:MAG: IclR family transcriptional regulator, partial [Bacilli bacterium]|nr:IclR family transcriptional regulator [Bacilli bacterium]
TAMGKVQLSQHTFEELIELYPDKSLRQKTQYTVNTLNELWKQILTIQENGFIKEYQEAVESFNCIAAPIFNHEKKIIGGVSITILSTNWEEKQHIAQSEIIDLARRISLKAGFITPVKSL